MRWVLLSRRIDIPGSHALLDLLGFAHIAIFIYAVESIKSRKTNNNGESHCEEKHSKAKNEGIHPFGESEVCTFHGFIFNGMIKKLIS